MLLHSSMSKLDIKNYLTSIYKLDIAKVNTRIAHGKMNLLFTLIFSFSAGWLNGGGGGGVWFFGCVGHK